MNRTLYHFPLSPFSRKIRIILKEKKLDFEPIIENYWERRREFLAMNPASQVPVLVEEGEILLADSGAILEYLEEKYTDIKLIGEDINDRAEVRRIANWFNNKFYYEVTKYIVDEKAMKFFKKLGSPNSRVLQASRKNMHYHLEYIAYLMRTRRWLAGEYFSIADITAASHLSVLDFLNEVPWEKYPEVKEWYSIVKSRPSFRDILNDKIVGFEPPKHYRDLDF